MAVAVRRAVPASATATMATSCSRCPATSSMAPFIQPPRPLQLTPPFAGGLGRVCGKVWLDAAQRRWWWDVDAKRKNFDKPAFTDTNYVYVRQQVPVVLLQDVPGLGRKGQIVSVKRGYARHNLVPKGMASFGTWENIDAYADPALLEDPSMKGRIAATRNRLPFDWVDELLLRFVRWARSDQLQTLLEPLTTWEVLQELSDRHELDLLPGNLDMPEVGITTVGMHEVGVRIPFRSPESATGRYTMRIEVLSKQSQEDLLRKEEMARAVEQSRRFELPQRALPGGDGAGGDEGFDDEDEE